MSGINWRASGLWPYLSLVAAVGPLRLLVVPVGEHKFSGYVLKISSQHGQLIDLLRFEMGTDVPASEADVLDWLKERATIEVQLWLDRLRAET